MSQSSSSSSSFESTRSLRSRKWVFTHHDYTDEDVKKLSTIKCKFLICGEEECPTSGRRHLQGFICFSNQLRFRTVKDNLFGHRTHVEVAKGNTQQNVEYCSKTREVDINPNEVVHTFGVPPKDTKSRNASGGAATRIRYEEAWESAKGGDLEEIDADLRIKHYTTFKRIANDAKLEDQSLQETDAKHEWYYGPSGTGKSYTARSENPDAYLKMCNKWWDGYQDGIDEGEAQQDNRHQQLPPQGNLDRQFGSWSDPAAVQDGGVFKRKFQTTRTCPFYIGDQLVGTSFPDCNSWGTGDVDFEMEQVFDCDTCPPTLGCNHPERPPLTSRKRVLSPCVLCDIGANYSSYHRLMHALDNKKKLDDYIETLMHEDVIEL